MIGTRKIELKKNFSRMFWIQALMNVKVISVVSTLFYLHRGLTLSEIFYLTVVWAIVSLLFEIPSSYLADRWGRKKTILLGILLSLAHWVLFIFADNIIIFAVGIALASLQFASFSGTDDALIYDTNKELGKKDKSIGKLGKYYSARSIFKIIAPLIGAFIANGLLEWQFLVVLAIDMIAVSISLFFAVKLTEPNHYVDVEEQEIGIIKDAWKIISSDKIIAKAILSRTLLFIAMFIIWRFHQKYFIDIGLSVWALGIAWSIIHICAFFYSQNIEKFLRRGDLNLEINFLNNLVIVFVWMLLFGVLFLPNPLLLLCIFVLLDVTELFRWPLYAEFYNRRSKSFNRATTLSLSNFFKSILDIPLLIIVSILISKSIIYPFMFAAGLATIILFFKLPKKLST
ncbi:MFS transporter [Candidatus Parcubacteria bacterium]|jgi:MFS family permease|nr:MFS transporter [Candidatus Parcubacteria bacterium]MBT3948524.1 MFS transporter [Candidatus Parcubacteria bacterium]